MMRKNKDKYFSKHLFTPLNDITHPKVYSSFEPSDILKISIIGYCKDNPDDGIDTTYDLSASSNPKHLFLTGEKSFIQTVSPYKLLNPLRITIVFTTFGTLAISKLVGDLAGNYEFDDKPRDLPTKFAIGFFTAPFKTTQACVGVEANIDKLPKFMNK